MINLRSDDLRDFSFVVNIKEIDLNVGEHLENIAFLIKCLVQTFKVIMKNNFQ